MEPKSRTVLHLARVPDTGEVYRCSDCRDMHLAWKNLLISMRAGEFIRFAQMVQAAAEHPAFGMNPAEMRR